MLRLPAFTVQEPSSVYGALTLLDELGERAMLLAGGTDLLPNLKHKLFEPEVVVSLARVEALHGIEATDDGGLSIGPMTTLAEVAASELVRERAPALAQAASLVAGPQLRSMGTLGGNVMLDTRCQWYNQTYFWREALGFCLKKDGSVCHVVAGGKKCVAAASNDTAPVLMTLGATLVFERLNEQRELPVDDLWAADGIWNKTAGRDELLTRVVLPPQAGRRAGSEDHAHRGAYGKLRDRGSIDFPLFGCAVRLDLDADGAVADADLCAVALVARPTRVKGVAELLRGTTPGEEAFTTAVQAVADAAYKQCRPMDNVPGDAAYRREMVPVYVRRTLLAAAAGEGPVHHV